jgi:hypothetical protein
MAEPRKDDVGTTGDGLGEGAGHAAASTNQGVGSGGAAESGVDDKASAESKGTIGSGTEDTNLTQASGGSVD